MSLAILGKIVLHFPMKSNGKEDEIMTPTVLLYNLDNEKGRKIKTLCLTLKLRARSVAPEDFGKTLNQVLGLDTTQEPAQEAQSFSDELMVMAGLSSRQMNDLLQGFRRKKIPSVDLKAVLTATNGSWNAFQLREELARERQAMLQGERAHQEENP